MIKKYGTLRIPPGCPRPGAGEHFPWQDEDGTLYQLRSIGCRPDPELGVVVDYFCPEAPGNETYTPPAPRPPDPPLEPTPPPPPPTREELVGALVRATGKLHEMVHQYDIKSTDKWDGQTLVPETVRAQVDYVHEILLALNHTEKS